MTAPTHDADPGPGPAETFSWTAHPARERRVAAWAGVVLIAAVSLGTASLGGHPAWSLLAVAVLVVALNRFFFPTRFVIDDDGITARYPLRRQRLAWRELRRFARDEYGGYLSTRARVSRFDLRGMHVLFGPDRRTVESRIAECLAQGAAS